MRITILIIALTVILFSCIPKHENKTEQLSEQITEFVESSKVETFLPMEEREFSLTEKDFGEIIELQLASG